MEKIEQLKEKIIDLKKKELEYVESIVKTGNDRILTDEEKLNIYRSLEKYKDMFNEAIKNYTTPKNINYVYYTSSDADSTYQFSFTSSSGTTTTGKTGNDANKQNNNDHNNNNDFNQRDKDFKKSDNNLLVINSKNNFQIYKFAFSFT